MTSIRNAVGIWCVGVVLVGCGAEPSASHRVVARGRGAGVDPAEVTDLVAGGQHTCGLLSDGTATCWGRSDRGQLGDDTSSPFPSGRPLPGPVIGLIGATQLAAGALHTCALLTDGTAKCWGDNTHGQLGDSTTANRSVPTAVSGLTGATQLAGGAYHTCALLTDGSAKCWGENGDGAVGDGTRTQRLVPTTVSGLTGATQLAGGGGHTCALLGDGTATCWGWNGDGQLGDGTGTARLVPTPVGGLSGATQLVAGNQHTCALLTDATVKCWGYNFYGTVGDGTGTGPRAVPTAVMGLTGATQLAAGYFHSCALLADGSARCWGFNALGEVGDGTTTHRLAPAPVATLTGSTQLTAGVGHHTCSLLADGTAKCWGSNDSGQLGDGTKTDRLVPTSVSL